MSDLDTKKVLPKGRAIPINGDLVRTKRIEAGYATPSAFAERLGMSEDRIIDIEKGGAKVYARTLVKISQLFDGNWENLLVQPISKSTNTISAVKPTAGNVVLVLVKIDDINNYDDEKINKLIDKIKNSIGLTDDVSVISVDDGSILITIMLTESDYVRLVFSFCHGKLDDFGFKEIKIQGIFYIWKKLIERFEVFRKVARESGTDNLDQSEIFDRRFLQGLISDLKWEYFNKRYSININKLPQYDDEEIEITLELTYLVKLGAFIIYTCLKVIDSKCSLSYDIDGVLVIRRSGLQSENRVKYS